MDGRALAVIIIAIVAIFALAFYGGIKLVGDPMVGVAAGLLGQITWAILAILLEPVRKWVSKLINERIFPKRVCRILVYGMPRSGKTTLIKGGLLVGKPRREKSTNTFVYREWEVPLASGEEVRVGVADYKGQKPSQVFRGHDPRFFGSEEPLVNAIVFVVDVVPEKVNEEGEILSKDELLEEYRINAREKVEKRVQEHLEYLSVWCIEPVFDISVSSRLLMVKIAVNKIDFLREVIARGYLEGVTLATMEEYLATLYRPLEERIEAACKANEDKAPDCKVQMHFVSGLTGENVKEMFGGIVEACRTAMEK